MSPRGYLAEFVSAARESRKGGLVQETWWYEPGLSAERVAEIRRPDLSSLTADDVPALQRLVTMLKGHGNGPEDPTVRKVSVLADCLKYCL